MNWIRRQLNEIFGLFFLSFGLTPTEAMKEQLGIAERKESETSLPADKKEPFEN